MTRPSKGVFEERVDEEAFSASMKRAAEALADAFVSIDTGGDDLRESAALDALTDVCDVMRENPQDFIDAALARQESRS